MTHRKKITSQSGFMSVEAVATTLFYLIMVGMITLVGSNIMNTGKMSSDLNALSMLRVNIQYVGTNAGSYTGVATLNLPALVPLLSPVMTIVEGEDEATLTLGSAKLPTGHKIKVQAAAAGSQIPEGNGTAVVEDETGDPGMFNIIISGLGGSDCRKVAYYGIAGGYGVQIGSTPLSTLIKKSTRVSDIETNCGNSTDLSVITLTSR